MTLTTRQSKTKRLTAGDPMFMIDDGFMLTARAGLEITSKCPVEYMRIIQHCLHKGWLIPVAHMTAEEYFIERLKQ